MQDATNLYGWELLSSADASFSLIVSSFGGDTTLCYTNNNGTASVWSHHFLPTAGRTLSSSTPTYPSTLDVSGGGFGQVQYTLQSTSSTDEIIYWKDDDTAGTTAIYYKVSESKWYDGSTDGQPTAFSINDGTISNPSAVVSEGDSVKLTAGSSGNYGSFTMFSNSSSTPTIQSVSINNGAWTDHTFTPDDNAVSGKYAWDLQHDAGSGFYKIGDLHSLEYIPGYGWFVINVNGDGFGDVSPTSSTSGTYLDANGTSQSFSSNFASSSNGVLTIAHGGGTITLNEADFFTNGVVPTPPTQITDLFASHASGD